MASAIIAGNVTSFRLALLERVMSMLGLLSELPVVTQPSNHDTESASSCRESLRRDRVELHKRNGCSRLCAPTTAIVGDAHCYK